MLASRTIGTGPHVILIHGWGWSSHVWAPLASKLAQDNTVTLIDLPGYGKNQQSNALTLSECIDDLSDTIDSLLKPDEQATLIGWSLGGMLAIQLASINPTKISGVMTLASNIQFTSSEKWPQAMDSSTFEHFQGFVAQQPVKRSLLRFYAIQAQDCLPSPQAAQWLKKTLTLNPLPQHRALISGLDMLAKINVGTLITTLNCPVTMIFGEHDPLIPVDATEDIGLNCPEVQLVIIKDGSHSFWLTDQQTIVDSLKVMQNEYSY